MAQRIDAPQGELRNVIDDEQLKKMMQANTPSFLERNRFRLVTFILIAINLVVFALEVLTAGLRVDIPTQVLVDMGAMYAPFIQTPLDWYRFITPMFLHVDLMHLAFNMVALYTVGEVLESTLGRGNFLLLYFVSGITGNVVSYVTDLFSAGGSAVSAGASTSVFGLFIAVALLGLLIKGNRSVFAQYSRSMLGVIAINVVYTLFVPGISMSGHLGGALGGLIAMFMIPSKNLRVPIVVRIVVAVVWVGALGFIAVSQGIVG